MDNIRIVFDTALSRVYQSIGNKGTEEYTPGKYAVRPGELFSQNVKRVDVKSFDDQFSFPVISTAAYNNLVAH